MFILPSKSNFDSFYKVIEKLKNIKTHLFAIHIANFLLYTIYRFIQVHKSQIKIQTDKEKQIEEEQKQKNKELFEKNKTLIYENETLINDKKTISDKNKEILNENNYLKEKNYILNQQIQTNCEYNNYFDIKYNIINKYHKKI